MENIKLFCVSLGCDKNLVDTEKMLGLLNGRGITFTDDETEADVILVNTLSEMPRRKVSTPSWTWPGIRRRGT